MGSDTRTYLLADDAQIALLKAELGVTPTADTWVTITDDADARALSVKRQATVVGWSMSSTVDQIWLRVWRAGNEVRSLLYNEGEWKIVSGEPQPFEKTSEIAGWLKRKRLLGNVHGYEILDAYLGLPISSVSVEGKSLQQVPRPAVEAPAVFRDRLRHLFEQTAVAKASRAVAVVESAEKATAVRKLLGAGAIVISTDGPLFELPSTLGVDLEGDCALFLNCTNPKVVTRVRESLKKRAELWLMMPEGPEGEALAARLAARVNPAVPVRRMPLAKPTRAAVAAAVKQPRTIDWALVDGHDAGQALRRLFALHVSAVLRRMLGLGTTVELETLPALRLLVAREWQRRGQSGRRTPRYTDAALANELGWLGLTAANLREVAVARFVRPRTDGLTPLWSAVFVVQLVDQLFGPPLAGDDFFAEARRELAEIAAGRADRIDFIRRTHARLEELCRLAAAKSPPPANAFVLGHGPDGQEILVKQGRSSVYVASGGAAATVPDELDPDQLTVERATALLVAVQPQTKS